MNNLFLMALLPNKARLGPEYVKSGNDYLRLLKYIKFFQWRKKIVQKIFCNKS